MDKIVSKIAALGVPDLVLIMALSATGLSGGAAFTTGLAALGPGGMLGGIITLVVIYLAGEHNRIRNRYDFYCGCKRIK